MTCVCTFWAIGLVESKLHVHFEMLAGAKQVNHLTVQGGVYLTSRLHGCT